MSKPGPTPAPTAIKMIRGDRRDRINHDEPLPPLGGVSPAGWLSPLAVEVWNDYGPALEQAAVLTQWDRESFARWCDGVVRHREAARHLDVEGPVVEVVARDNHGKVTGTREAVSPWFRIWLATGEVANRIGAKFGMTPSDRSGLRVQPARPPDSTDRF